MYIGRLFRDLVIRRKEEIDYNEELVESLKEYINELLPLVKEFLEIELQPNIFFGELPQNMYGLYQSGNITISVENIMKIKIRNKSVLGFCIAEFLSHEMTHYKQDLEGRIPLFNKTFGQISYLEYVSQPIEVEANKNSMKFTNKYQKQIDKIISKLL